MAKAPVKENQFDARRETLVVETKTTWEPGVHVDDVAKARIGQALHRDPENAKKLEYVRCPTGFIRCITVTAEDVERVGRG